MTFRGIQTHNMAKYSSCTHCESSTRIIHCVRPENFACIKRVFASAATTRHWSSALPAIAVTFQPNDVYLLFTVCLCKTQDSAGMCLCGTSVRLWVGSILGIFRSASSRRHTWTQEIARRLRTERERASLWLRVFVDAVARRLVRMRL